MAKKGYCIIIRNLSYNPSDGSVTYLRQSSNSSSSQSRVLVPISGTIRKITVSFCNAGILGSSETGSVYLNLNGATNQTLISDTVKNDSVNTSYTNNNLSVVVTTSDYINIQISSPTWVTNPTTVNVNAYIRVE